MQPSQAFVGAILAAEIYRRYVPSATKTKWQNWVGMHHGEAGLIGALIGEATGSPNLAAASLGLMLHDWPDKNKWFKGQ
jgi:hypothetical protein